MTLASGIHMRNKPQFQISAYATGPSYARGSALVDLSNWTKSIEGSVGNQAPGRVVASGSDVVHHLSADRVEYQDIVVTLYKSWAASGPDVTLKAIFEHGRPCAIAMKDESEKLNHDTSPFLLTVAIPNGGWAPVSSEVEASEGAMYTVNFMPVSVIKIHDQTGANDVPVIGDFPANAYTDFS